MSSREDELRVSVRDVDALWRDPAHWDRFEVYRCADDSRLFVPARLGLGWTMNMAHPRAQPALWATLAVVIVFVVVLGVWVRFR